MEGEEDEAFEIDVRDCAILVEFSSFGFREKHSALDESDFALLPVSVRFGRSGEELDDEEADRRLESFGKERKCEGRGLVNLASDSVNPKSLLRACARDRDRGARGETGTEGEKASAGRLTALRR